MSYIPAAILVTALVTYALRTLPLLVLRRDIKSPWVNSFLYYVPWAVLAVLGIGVALVLSWRGQSLFVVAVAAAVTVWVCEVAPGFLSALS